MRFYLEMSGLEQYIEPMLTKDKDQCESKYRDNEIMNEQDELRLRGALYCLLDNNFWDDENANRIIDGMKDSAFCGNDLYMNSFEGYELSERLKARSLYINKNDKVVLSVEDTEKDRYLTFII